MPTPNPSRRLRKKYKALYLKERGKASIYREEAEYLDRELNRIRMLLAPEGENILKSIDPSGTGPIYMTPLMIECYDSYFHFNQRFTSSRSTHGGFIQRSFRDRPILAEDSQ